MGFRNPRHIAVCDRTGCLGRHITQRKARATRGQHEVAALLVAQAAQRVLDGLLIVGHNHATAFVKASRQQLGNQRAAFVLTRARRALVARGHNADLEAQPHVHTALDRTPAQHAGEHALARHDAVAHALPNCAAMVTFLSDLGDFEQRVSAPEPRADRQTAEVDALDQQVFPERTVGHARTARIESSTLS